MKKKWDQVTEFLRSRGGRSMSKDFGSIDLKQTLVDSAADGAIDEGKIFNRKQ